VAKIEAYKFVNPGVLTAKTPAVVAARQSLLASNRLGKTITGLGNEVVDINKITNLRLKIADRAEIAERRAKRKAQDQEAEALQESVAGRKNLSDYFNEQGKKKLRKGSIKGNIGKMFKGAFGWIQPLLGPFVDMFVKIGALAFMNELLKWASDEENIAKMDLFFCKAEFVFKKIYGFGKWIIKDNLIDGFNQLFGSDETLLGRVEGLGKLMTGVIGLRYLMAPWKLITDILNMLNVITGKKFNPNRKPPGTNRKPPGTNFRPKVTTSSGASAGPLRGIREFFRKFKPKPKPTVSGQTGNWFSNLFKKKPTVTSSGQGNWLSNLFKKKPTVTSSGATKGNWLSNLFKKKPTTSGSPPPSITPPKVTIGTGGVKPNVIKNALSKVKPGTALSGVKGFGVGLVLDYAVNSIADTLITQPMQRATNNKREEKVNQKFLELGSEGTVKFYEEALAKENSKKGLNWWQNAATLGFGNIFVGPSKPVVADLEYKLNYARQLTTNKDLTPLYEKFQPKEEKKKKGLFGLGFLGLQKGGKLPQFFLGGLFKGIKRAVSGVVNTVGKVVSGVVNTVTNVVSNPIVSTALSFIPGIGPIVGAINAVTNLSQGNILGAITSGIGAIGNFAAIGSTAKSVVDTPNWLMNLRMSKFGRGLSNLYTKGANIFGKASTFLSNTVGAITDSRIGKIGMKLLGGNMGGAIGEVVGMIPGLEGRMQGFGNWLEKNQLQGILGAVPGVSGLLKNIPNIMSIPGMEKILGADGYGFSATRALGSVADRFGMGGVYAAIMSGAQSGDYIQGLSGLAGELGVDPRILGVLDKGRALLRDNKFNAEYAMQTAIEFLPVPLIVEKLVPAPTPVPINSGDTYLVAPGSTASRK
tara:strand:- start:16029 stop:18632 length:2604 start_codon:yes stop_codon:yes gene_type:complete